MNLIPAIPRPNGETRWQRIGFHLTALLILPVALYLPSWLEQPRKPFAQPRYEAMAGPFEVALWQSDTLPGDRTPNGYGKGFMLSVCEGCDARIRAAYLRTGKPRSIRAAGTIFSMGWRGHRSVWIQMPESTAENAELWLTIEGWDGSLHHAKWALSTVAPATAALFATD